MEVEALQTRHFLGGRPADDTYCAGRFVATVRAETPTASPEPGEVDSSTLVTITSATQGAVIHYTLDGTEPTEESDVLAAPIAITEATTIRAVAIRQDMLPSEVMTASYTVAPEKLPPDRVVATVNGVRVMDGDTVKAGKLVLTCATEGAEIWYTTNGVCPCDDPDARKQYTEPIDLEPGAYFFRIRAYKDGLWSEGLPLHLTVEAADVTNPFVDVVEGDYFYDPVMWAIAHDPVITMGIDATHFGPANTCTRGQVVTFLWRAAGQPELAGTDNPFTDVAETDYYYKPVLWAVENGITMGTSATTFGPGDPCTRAQVVTFQWRAAGKPEVTGSNPFTDVAEGDYFYAPVLWAVANNITLGTSATNFSPANPCTRGQIVTFLYRARDL